MLLDAERAVGRRTVAALVRVFGGQNSRRSLAAEEASPNVATGLTLRETRIKSSAEEEVLGLFVGDRARTDELPDGGRGSEGNAGSTG